MLLVVGGAARIGFDVDLADRRLAGAPQGLLPRSPGRAARLGRGKPHRTVDRGAQDKTQVFDLAAVEIERK